MIPPGPWRDTTYAAQMLGMSDKFGEQTVAKYARRKKIKGYNPDGKRWLFKDQWIEEFIKERMNR
jgi:hypothetical protein